MSTGDRDGELPSVGFEVRDPQRFAQNMARLVEEAGKAFTAWAEPQMKQNAPTVSQTDMMQAFASFAEVQRAWIARPQRMVTASAALWARHFDLLNSFLPYPFTTPRATAEPDSAPDPKDKRFRGEAWSQKDYFDYMKRAYLITSKWATSLVDETDNMPAEAQQKASFWTRQLINAIAPSNWVFTNPELLREVFASDGENLVRGMALLAEDIRHGGGELKIRQTDPTAFEVGKNIASTPGKVIFQGELLQLIQYEPSTEKVLKRPLLIVPPWINKYYILDLTPDKSFIKWAVDQGHTVFVISWVNPDERLASKTFEDYMLEGVAGAVDAVCGATGEEEINAIGYCVGGTVLASTLAYMAAKGDTRVKAATFFTTQVDFEHAGDLKVFADEQQIVSIEREMAQRGYLDSSKMATIFNLLRSNDLIWPYIVNVYLRGTEPVPFDLLFWNSDSTRMPAANHSFYLRRCYLQNDLSAGRVTISGVPLDLRKIEIPIYSLATREDHIAPPASVFKGAQCFGGPVRFVLAASGHTAGVVSPPGKSRYPHWTDGPPQGELENWIARAEERPGSWWPDWQAWIVSQDDRKVAARQPGGGHFLPIEDAPGSYVRTIA